MKTGQEGQGLVFFGRALEIEREEPVIYFNLIITSIFVLQIFVQSYVGYDYAGGADRAALFYTMHLINHGFVYLRMGYACAMAWILFVLVAALTYLAHRLSEKRVHYGGA